MYVKGTVGGVQFIGVSLASGKLLSLAITSVWTILFVVTVTLLILEKIMKGDHKYRVLCEELRICCAAVQLSRCTAP
jgi:hypothetical protein